MTGHLSAGVSHFGNISYYLGESNQVSPAEIEAVISKVKSLDDNVVTLQRTIEHLKANDVNLDKTPLSLGPMLQFDARRSVSLNNEKANALLTREYRSGFEVPSGDKV